jgi:L-seryl-tRNA(Ser) seleniumtransferase
VVERLKKDPLARALRADKLALAALEATLALYADPARAAREIPTLAMLRATPEALEPRARRLADALKARLPSLAVRVERGDGEAGGGSLPLQKLPGWVVEVELPGRTANQLDRLAHAAEPPVIGTIRAGRFRLDPRTLAEAEIEEAAEVLARAWAQPGAPAKATVDARDLDSAAETHAPEPGRVREETAANDQRAAKSARSEPPRMHSGVDRRPRSR